MMYQEHYSLRKLPQSIGLPGQELNAAGGYTWSVGDWGLLERFLVLGTIGGTYYAGEAQLTVEVAQCVIRCLNENSDRTIDMIHNVSVTGRAVKQEPALYALAIALANPDVLIRQAAASKFLEIVRTGTHLFLFMTYVKNMRGMGSLLKRTIANWYLSKPFDDLVYQVIKYRQRYGWTHRDVLRLVHPQTDSKELNSLFKWITQEKDTFSEYPPLLSGYMQAQIAQNPGEVAELVSNYSLSHEMLPTKFRNDPGVWKALLPNLPMGALFRNLSALGRVGVLKDAANIICSRLTDQEAIHRSRLHPVKIISSLLGYIKGENRSGTWIPVPSVIDALDTAFYLSFNNVEPLNQRVLLGLDVSGSMGWQNVQGMADLQCLQAAAIMAMVTVQTEKDVTIMAFDRHTYNVPLSKRMRFDTVSTMLEQYGGGGTDCSLPIQYALEHTLDLDLIVIYTDNMTWAGNTHPTQAFREYQNRVNPRTKLAVVHMSAGTIETITDSGDPNQMNFIGFDTSTPQAIAEFAR